MLTLTRAVMDKLDWLTQRLDQKRHLPAGQPADNLDLHRLLRYRQPVGFKVKVKAAYGLKGQCGW